MSAYRITLLSTVLLTGGLGTSLAVGAQDPPFPVSVSVCAVPPSPSTDTWPAAVTDSLGSTPGAPVTFSGATLVANDTGTAVTIRSVGPLSSNGGAITGAGPFTFTPRAGFTGSDIIPYEIKDASNRMTVGLIEINVTRDLVQPTVSISAPPGGTVAGNVVIRAVASDNVGVSGVAFFDGATPIGSEVLAAPFQTAWSTTLVSDGSHSLTAIARDVAGNTATSVPVVVNVLNASLATVPSVVGMLQSVARTTLTGAGFAVGPSTTAQSATAAGTVISQSPAAGTTAAAGSAVTFVVSLGPPPPAGGLVLALGFDEPSGSTALDTSGGNQNGTILGAQRVAGRIGGALAFDGVNDWVTVPDSAALDLTTALTVEAWVKPDALNGWDTVLMKERGADDFAYGLYANDGAPFAGGTAAPSGVVRAGGAHQTVLGRSPLTVGVWQHVAGTYDGTTQRLFINGVEVGSRPQAGLAAVSAGVLRIGGNASFAGEFFQGAIDDVRIYNRALSATEIGADVATAGTPPPPPPPPPPSEGGLVLSFNFDEASGNAIDASGQNHVGTIRGALRVGGVRGNALSFNGVSDWVTVADANSLDLTTGMTLQAWVKPVTLGGWDTIILKEHGVDAFSYALYAHDGGALSGGAPVPSGNVRIGAAPQTLRGTAQLAAGVWTHLATTYDGVTQRLFVNGVQVTSRPQSGGISVGTGVLRIGGNSSFPGEFYTGLVDDVRVFKRALTATEIAANMNQ
jgi:hypothetical protein